MNEHAKISDLLPFYSAGRLDEEIRREVEQHLAGCAGCRSDLALWLAVKSEVAQANRPLSAPPALPDLALQQIHHTRLGPGAAFRRACQLLFAQAMLVQREMWPACAATMAIGAIVALLSDRIEVISLVAPLVAASSLASLSGPDFDPALELALATPTSPWKVLLARLSIVSAYNLLLALAATLALLVIVPPGLLGTIILGWLAPMSFLSALALLLSLWIGYKYAIAIAYGLWLAQYVPYQSLGMWMVSPAWQPIIAAYQQFWRSPALLFLSSIVLFGMILWSANRPVSRLSQSTG